MAASTGPVVRHRSGAPTPLDQAWTLVRAALEPCRRRPTAANEAALVAALHAYRNAVVEDVAGPFGDPDKVPMRGAAEAEEWPF